MSASSDAIELSQEPGSYRYFYDLAFEHITDFYWSGSIEDITKAIEALKKASSISSNSDALVNLANFLFKRFELTKDTLDLDGAIAMQQQGIALQTEANAGSFDNLGKMLQFRFEKYSSSNEDFEGAMQAFHSAMSTTSGKPNIRLESARAYAELRQRRHGASSVLDIYKFAMDLIPHLSRVATPLNIRYMWIPCIRDTVDAAVAAAIEAGDLALALEWFEKGRCIVWGQVLRLRTPLDDLRDVAPKLAEEVHGVLEQISVTTDTLEMLLNQAIRSDVVDQTREKGRKLASRLDELVQDVRRLEGFRNFMQQETLEELRGAAVHGPIVALNVSPRRCDALALVPGCDAIVHVPLPDVTHGKIAQMRAYFQDSLRRAGVRNRAFGPANTQRGVAFGSMEPVLSKLWSHVVAPVLKTLGYLDKTCAPNLEPHRITWCPSGPLSFLPLHAAGIYDTRQADRPRVFDFIVSSYTPSLSALLSAVRRKNLQSMQHKGPRVLAISQPATPNQSPLPGTVKEVVTVQTTVGAEKLTWLNDADATTTSVLGLMEKHAWVHLACHAVQDVDAPTLSAFMLHDGGMALRAIMKLAFGTQELAVLSACQTATGEGEFSEEAVHLAAGMLMAGYPSVIATMWSIGDEDAPIVMEKLYSYLLGEAGGDSGYSAHALHYAVQHLRESVGENSFLKWVPFIHVGI
ncbi:hypothetical protein BV22DRAFT_1131663 [Leucogyrophana mollusca]|uniref:Uncharacterized protein n=1 Tax=Leucogyrophana mollusca TaxID=85980 RepID=A0ACB8B8N2_9AGAM|nr:hypothetical protein BV22DRAFT_1131663 [Leucogyrophana mollusca]